jgi:hypothetical protein
MRSWQCWSEARGRLRRERRRREWARFGSRCRCGRTATAAGTRADVTKRRWRAVQNAGGGLEEARAEGEALAQA